jgi:DNA-binding MarR family transcriptional regulator
MPARSATPSPTSGRTAWHRLLQVSRRVLRELDVRLDEEHRIGVNEFDVLITLDNAQDRRLRMTDLAEAVMFSSGGLTRLVGRLEARGLVRRTPDPGDARSLRAELTAQGSARLKAARVTHDAVIEELLGSRLSGREMASLAAALGRALPASDGGALP